ncbi:uncharacterized protein B0T23DRAFT_391083 [Neurospora hispaniola]|uniref:Uncharacterized protein n=1 Tax=Neurospora hispaniola TaxID=588809 RepID=A0AAJ0HXZ5_9PEZI|nr:hypothetical protein B0T23DRAFT_391083 [Neurospora hispaniola]
MLLGGQKVARMPDKQSVPGGLVGIVHCLSGLCIAKGDRAARGRCSSVALVLVLGLVLGLAVVSSGTIPASRLWICQVLPPSSPPLSLLFPAYNGPGGGGGARGRHQGCCRRRECRLQPPACAVWLPRRQIISVVRDAGVAVGVVGAGTGSWVVAGNVQISVMTERVTLTSKW